jgi:hypothetical protein
MKPGETRRFHDLTVTAMQLAVDLLKAPDCEKRGGAGSAYDGFTCIQREHDRPLSIPAARGQRRTEAARSFANFDESRLCRPCRCYWYAERASQELQALALFEREREARAAVDTSTEAPTSGDCGPGRYSRARKARRAAEGGKS